LTALRAWSITWVGGLVSVQWVNNLFSHLVRLPLQFFEHHAMGDVVSRFGSVRTIQKTLTGHFVGAVLDGVMSVLTLALMCVYSLPLTIFVAAAFGLYALFRLAIFQSLRRATEEQIVYAARQQTVLLESIRAIQAIKITNQQDHRRVRYANAMVDTTNREIAVQRLAIGFHAGNGVIFGVLRVVLVWYAAALVLKGEFSAGMLVAFIAYADQFSRRAAGLIDRWNEFRMLTLHAERVGEIALAPPEPYLEGIHSGTLGEARLEVCDLSFRYSDNDPWVIEGLCLTVEPGESVAIAAPSGTGKTTLAKLVLGLLTPSRGKIKFCGVDIRKLGLAQYRGFVGAVMQDDQLFTGSVADNISLFDPDATLGRVERAAHLARIHNEISEMPMGYETEMTDMGSSFSGGQKQRVLLARALYREPKFLVLDEATSHLDVSCEREINALVKRLKITRLILAHRPETLASADRVIVLGRAGLHEQTNCG
ncbi:MAG: peptidase domain-containing ABC transporter, partial [Gammaproteobacteria bacterium]|nr:peptidase domain-containing ABC transporter [Gammaproteobacteria bacterium]